MEDEPLPNQTPLEELRQRALEHYREASNAIMHWSSFVEAAIKTYNPKNSDNEKRDENSL